MNKNIIYLWFPPKDYGIGGMYAHVKGIISGFIKNGYIVTLITSSKNIPLIHPNLKIEYIENKSKGIYPLNMKMYSNIIFPRILDLQKELNPEFIYHRYELYIDIFERLRKSNINCRLILEYNGSYVWTIKHWTGHLIKKMAGLLILNNIKIFEKTQLESSNNIVVISNAQKEEIIADYNISDEKINTVTNGFDPMVFYPKEKNSNLLLKYNLNNKKVIGFSGTFGPWHGADILAKSIKEIVAKRKDIHFLFMGDGLFKKNCEKIVLENEVSKYCTFTGKINFSEMNEYLNLCDVLVNPTLENKDGSEFFGSPTKLFEYMGTEKTIVTSDIGQMKEIFNDNEVYFTNSGNATDLSEKTLLAIDNPRKVKNKDKFTWKEIAKNIIEYNK